MKNVGSPHKNLHGVSQNEYMSCFRVGETVNSAPLDITFDPRVNTSENGARNLAGDRRYVILQTGAMAAISRTWEGVGMVLRGDSFTPLLPDSSISACNANDERIYLGVVFGELSEHRKSCHVTLREAGIKK